MSPLRPASSATLLDVRPESAFVEGHVSGAAGIPLEELPRRMHELPARGNPFSVIDADPARAEQAAALLQERGHVVSVIAWDQSKAVERGLSTTQLWRPNPFLLEALWRIKNDSARLLPEHPRALDVASGSGRDAVWLALAGYDVEAIDLLPDALDRARDLANRTGVSLRTIVHDLHADPTLPTVQYQLVAVFRYLQRNLFPTLRHAVAPGGYIVYETFHQRNRETGHRPLNPDHLLNDGELAAAFEGFEILIARDAFARDGRYFSSLLARRPERAEC